MRIEVKNNVINKEVLERNKKYLIPNWKNNLARIYIILNITEWQGHSIR